MEDRLAVILAAIRRQAQDAIRRGVKLDPRKILAAADGKGKA